MRADVLNVLNQYGASDIDFIRSILCVRFIDLKTVLQCMIVDRAIYVNSQNKYDLV